MSWQELTRLRSRHGRTYRSEDQPGLRCFEGSIAAIHYEGALDSGAYDTPLDLTPIRVDNAQLDGWIAEHSDYHYALGKPGDKATDGWVGFGGRQGSHWFKFRLARLGYLHWPSRTWDDLAGPPTYDRANLTYQPHTTKIGPHEDQIRNAASVEWTNVWTTPTGAGAGIQWRIDGDRLKEDVIISQTAREWIQTYRPPIWPADETYFGFVFQVDWSDIPQIIIAGLTQDPDTDFDDENALPILRDDLDRLLGFMPFSEVTVPGVEPPATAPLRKRFWLDPDGNHYILVGCRCDLLADLPAGDLVFDPTIEPQVGASNHDAVEESDGTVSLTYPRVTMGNKSGYIHSGMYFGGVTIPSSPTITTAYIIYVADLTDEEDFENDIYGQDSGTPSVFTTSGDNISTRSRTTALVQCDASDAGSWTAEQTYYSPEIKTIIQELVDTYDYTSGASMVLMNIWQSGTGDRSAKAYDESTSLCPKLHIEYTTSQADGGFFGLAGALFHFLAKAPTEATAVILRRRREGY
jgi:hypothetical protein